MKVSVPKVTISPAMTRIAAAVIGIAILLNAGLRASKAGHERRVSLRTARQTLAAFEDWRRRYQPAVAAESLAWRRARMEVQDLGIVGDERLALTRSVARAAESVGLRDVRVVIGEADTTDADARLSSEGVRRRSAPFGLEVECRGNLQEVVAFLGALPPSVAPTGLRLVRQDARGRHRLTLAVFEIESADVLLPNPTPHATLSPPLERGNARVSGADRLGG